MDKKYFVYMHISPSNKRYIGITSKEKVEQRWLKNGKGYKGQSYFYNAIQKYGWDKFQHIIVARNLSEDEAKWLEIEMIKQWKTSNQRFGYNRTEGGDKSHNYTEEEKEEIRKVSKEKATEQWSEEGAREKHSELMKKKMQEFYKTEKGKEHKKTLAKKNRRSETLLKQPKGVICLETKCFFCSMSSAEKHYGIDKSVICRSCKNKRNAKTKTGLHWRTVNYKHNKILRRKEAS